MSRAVEMARHQLAGYSRSRNPLNIRKSWEYKNGRMTHEHHSTKFMLKKLMNALRGAERSRAKQSAAGKGGLSRRHLWAAADDRIRSKGDTDANVSVRGGF